jgi:sugar phosphate isomerase/epimerase
MSAPAATNWPILSTHSWSYAGQTLESMMKTVSDAGYAGIDLGSGELGRAAGLKVEAVLANAMKADEIKRLANQFQLRLNDYFAWLPHAVNTTSPTERAENRDAFTELVPRLLNAGVHGITLSPGGFEEDRWAASFETTAAALRELVGIADGRLPVRIEAHVESVTDTPERTLAMLDAVPDLTLTHDYSHYVVQGIAEAEIEPLTTFATHFHIHQAREGVLAERVVDGTIDVPRLLKRLLDQRYAGGLTVEYVSSPWRGQDVVDSTVENAAMFAQVKSVLAELTLTEPTR